MFRSEGTARSGSAEREGTAPGDPPERESTAPDGSPERGDIARSVSTGREGTAHDGPPVYVPPGEDEDAPVYVPPTERGETDGSEGVAPGSNGLDLSILDELDPFPDAPAPADPVPEGKKKKKRKKPRRKGCFSAVVWVIGIIVASVGLTFGALTVVADFLGIGKSGTVQLEIKPGTSSANIARQLDDTGVVRFGTLFRVYSKFMHFDGTYQYGVYTIDKENGYEAIAHILQEEGAKAETVTVTIPQGAGMDEIRRRFVEAGICTEDEFREAAGDLDYYSEFDFVSEIPVERVYYKLEGYLFPETYSFYKYGGVECAKEAIKKCLQQMDDELRPYRDEIKKSGYTVHEILTLASVIELETNGSSDADKAKVSAVFQNRLKWTGEPRLLGSTPTSKYPYGNGRYDTNKTEGLPPGPLCTSTAASIKAAVRPEKDFDYDYFVTDKNGQFYYNKTIDQHNATIADLKRRGLWA